MTKLTEKEREIFYKILREDLSAIDCAVVEQIKEIWNRTRDQILYERGLDTKIARNEEIKIKIAELEQELHDIEEKLHSEKLTIQQKIELGGSANEYSRYSDGRFFGIPVTSQLEYDIVQRIKQCIDTEAPAKYLHDLSRSVYREVAMSGTFEEAQKHYALLYSLDFRKYGVDIPPRLAEIQPANPTLMDPQKPLLMGKKESDQKDVS